MGQWSPSKISRIVRELPGTSTKPILVKTDEGLALLKYMGNPQGDFALFSEWVCANLAQELGVEIPNFAIMHCDSLELVKAMIRTVEGPAFLSRWNEEAESFTDPMMCIGTLREPRGLELLLAFDTWIKNTDRFGDPNLPNLDNLLLVPDKRKSKWVAIDHTHALIDWDEEELREPDWPEDRLLYGACDQMMPHMDRSAVRDALFLMKRIDRKTIEDIVNQAPAEWGPVSSIRATLVDHLLRRAALMQDWFEGEVFPQAGFDFDA